MVQYDDLPAELRTLFGNSSIPSETRAAINNGWNKMKPSSQQQLLHKLRREPEPLKRILIAVVDATKVLLSQPLGEESWLERLEGKKVREVTRYQCEKYSGEELPQLVTFEDGTQGIQCDFLTLGICSKCDYFKPLSSFYE